MVTAAEGPHVTVRLGAPKLLSPPLVDVHLFSFRDRHNESAITDSHWCFDREFLKKAVI